MQKAGFLTTRLILSWLARPPLVLVNGVVLNYAKGLYYLCIKIKALMSQAFCLRLCFRTYAKIRDSYDAAVWSGVKKQKTASTRKKNNMLSLPDVFLSVMDSLSTC